MAKAKLTGARHHPTVGIPIHFFFFFFFPVKHSFISHFFRISRGYHFFTKKKKKIRNKVEDFSVEREHSSEFIRFKYLAVRWLLNHIFFILLLKKSARFLSPTCSLHQHQHQHPHPHQQQRRATYSYNIERFRFSSRKREEEQQFMKVAVPKIVISSSQKITILILIL